MEEGGIEIFYVFEGGGRKNCLHIWEEGHDNFYHHRTFESPTSTPQL